MSKSLNWTKGTAKNAHLNQFSPNPLKKAKSTSVPVNVKKVGSKKA